MECYHIACFDICSKLPGKKDLFIEADLMSPLDRIANVTTLKVGVGPALDHIGNHLLNFVILICFLQCVFPKRQESSEFAVLFTGSFFNIYSNMK